MKKRMVSLLLALGCMLSLSAPAFAFTDNEDITHWEAVAVLSSLNIIEDKNAGAFDPTAAVSRGEAVKMIFHVLYEDKENSPTYQPQETESTRFTDVTRGHWAERYVIYCTEANIINGRGDGIFSPEDNVTGSEFAKMCLCMLGYEVDVFGLTGPDWMISTNAVANYTDVRLYDGLMEEMDPNEAITREQAAQMLFNALKAAPMVKKPALQSDGTVTFTFEKATREDGTPMTLLEMQFGIKPEECLPDYPQPEK